MLGALRTCASICLWAWLVLSASRAAALELSWSAPASCPAQSVVEGRLDALLGARAKPSELRAKLKVEPHRAGFKLTLQLDGEGVRGTRVLTGSDCAALADTAAWLVANAIDPGLSLLPPPAPVPEPPAPEPTIAAPAPAKPALPAPVPAAAEPSPWVLHADLHGGLWHVMDRPAGQWAVGAGLGASWKWLLAELRMDVGIPRESGIGTRGATVDAASQSLGLAACGLWGGWLRAGPCVGLAAVRSHALASGLLDPGGPRSVYWAEARAGAQVAARLAWPVELYLEGGVGGPVSHRPRFVAGTADPLEGERVTVYGRVGLRFRYPISPAARR